MRRRTGRSVRAVLAVAAALIFGTTTAAEGITGTSYDISWPQCPHGNPMPPTSAASVVIGLTRGLPFTVNPCLGSQVTWARTHQVPATAYLMAAYPTGAQLAAYGGRGPWTGNSLQARLRNVGYAEAVDARNRMRNEGLRFSPVMIWIDVEARAAQPWPGGSVQARARNRWVVEGIMRALGDAGTRFGIYANGDAWRTITGPWSLPGVPFWGTVGRRGAAAATSACRAPSLSGGPLHMVQWTNGSYDYDVRCSAFTLRPRHPYPAAAPHDHTGDWRTDLLARTRDGQLFLYPQTSRSTLGSRIRIGGNWRGYRLLASSADLSGDGVPDLVGVAGDGRVYLFRGSTGSGRPGTGRTALASGWGSMDRLLTPGDANGDGHADLLARDRTGRLWLYPGNGRGGLGARTLVGSYGWQMYDALTVPGDLTGDGVPDLLARTRSGRLWLYPGNGRGGLGARTLVGSYGWQTYDLLRGVPDLTGDGIPDLVTRTRKGDLWVYSGTGSGRLAGRRLLGRYGWGVFDTLG